VADIEVEEVDVGGRSQARLRRFSLEGGRRLGRYSLECCGGRERGGRGGEEQRCLRPKERE
jgi:hypothetical protein